MSELISKIYNISVTIEDSISASAMVEIASKITDMITGIITALVAVCGGIFALHQWRKGNRIKRAEFIKEITEKITSDKEIKTVIYTLDSKTQKNWLDGSFWGGKFEPEMDEFLAYLTYICYLFEEKIINKKEFDIFKYYVRLACLNEDVRNYLWIIYHQSKECTKEGTGTSCPYLHLIIYLKKYIFNKDQKKKFENSDSEKSGYKLKKEITEACT